MKAYKNINTFFFFKRRNFETGGLFSNMKREEKETFSADRLHKYIQNTGTTFFEDESSMIW